MFELDSLQNELIEIFQTIVNDSKYPCAIFQWVFTYFCTIVKSDYYLLYK